MAVAVKTPPGARPAGLPGGAALISLVGVVYLVACLAIVFKLLPSFWWTAWETIGLGSYRFLGGLSLVGASLAALVGLVWSAGKLLGPKPPVGIRAGVFVGFAGVLLVLFLARWASVWFEHYTFVTYSLTPTTGAILTGVTAAALLLGWIFAFTRPWTQAQIVRLEEAGWFHATWYKSNQGRMVRQGTIIGLLLIAGAGVYSLLTGSALRRGSPDFALDIPFTTKMAVDSIGDAAEFLEATIDPSKTQVKIRWPGAASLNLKANDVLTVEEFRAKVKKALEDQTIPEQTVPESVRQKMNAAPDHPISFLLAENRIIYSGIEQVLTGPAFHDDIKRRLREVDSQTDWADLSKYLAAVKNEAELAKKTAALGWVLTLPTAVPVIDKADLQTANEQTKPSKNVRVGIRLNPSFQYPEGKVVSAKEFDDEEVRICTEMAKQELIGADDEKVLKDLEEAKNGEEFRAAVKQWLKDTPDGPRKTRLGVLSAKLGRDEQAREAKSIPPTIPVRVDLSPAYGTPQAASVTLLPAKQYTIPLLLLGAACWLAWRVVNMPAFADFLIATEAELNKVSWTTQKRLIQDTIVVLVTVVAMSLFLFGTDYFWKTVLSWKHIGVLHIPEDSSEKQKIEDRKW